MSIKNISAIIILATIASYGFASDDVSKLTVYYFHRPPYYVKTDGEPKGFLMVFVERVLEKAGIEAEFKEVPPKRILEELKKPQLACSPGWFKTPEREELYLFSATIYQNAPLTFVVTKSKEKTRITLDEISNLFKSSRDPGIVCGFSYGPFLDAVFSTEKATRCISTDVLNVVRMVSAGRVDFTLISPEELGYIASIYPELRESIAMVPIEGIPEGNRRYLMCSKGVTPDMMDRINRAIHELVSWLD
ncbi:MAG: transporter substrate-binding domain-containing protein [Thermodesulforhabdaceae bacterium]